MITNTAFAAALFTFVIVGWLAGELSFLAPYKGLLFREHGVLLGAGVLLLFFNLCALCYGVARCLFVRDTGRKLTHLDRQLRSADTPHEELGAYLTSDER
jgi:hypothetical protein